MSPGNGSEESPGDGDDGGSEQTPADDKPADHLSQTSWPLEPATNDADTGAEGEARGGASASEDEAS